MAEKATDLNEVYALIRDAMNRMSQIPDSELASAKRQMYVLEDMLWQAIAEEGVAEHEQV